MVMRLYLDGCSLTYGQGLPRDQSLGDLFRVVGDYEVLDMSRPGKSNIAIALDTYQYHRDFDVFVIGWTYSGRFGIKYQDQNIDFFPGLNGNQRDLEPQSLDQAFINVYKFFYTIYDPSFYNGLSNFLIDGINSFLIQQNKMVRSFSWEKREVTSKIYYPYIGPDQRLEDGHLNSNGVRELYNFLQNLNINE